LATSKLKGSHSDAKETTPALGPKLTVKNNPFGVLSPWKETEFLACFCLCFLVTHVGPSLTGSEMWVPSVLGAPELDFGSSSLASELQFQGIKTFIRISGDLEAFSHMDI
jgi:hypothetical protein